MVIQSDFEDNNKLYKWYPIITYRDINSNTSPVFEDTLSICNGLIGCVLTVDLILTWCDLFYMAACDVTSDKMVLITRFPIDSFLNQIVLPLVVF